MRVNRAFLRALHSLTHPMIVSAVVLLLLNDHVLRVESPSWLTGKLGDAAWLVFAPIICALVVAWLVPAKHPQQERLVGLVAFGFIGAWFALGKTVPAVHAATITVLDAIVGWHGTLGLDPTDLLTLPALLLGWTVWTQPQRKRMSLAPFAWVVLALGVMSTVANSCVPSDYGITHICQSGSVYYTSPSSGMMLGYVSYDGGLSWAESRSNVGFEDCSPNPQMTSRPIDQPAARLFSAGSQTYRLVPGVGIYSYDHQYERLEIDLTALGTSAHRAYYEDYGPSFACGTRVFVPGPLDAVFDSNRGNLVLAMGLDGVLVRESDGTWQWATVGTYRYAEQQNDLLTLLKPHLLAALALFPILFATLALPMQKPSAVRTFAIGIGWVFGFAIASFATLLSLGSVGLAILAVYIVLCIALVTFVVEAVFAQHRHSRPLLAILLLTLTIIGLYLSPYILWARGTMPNIETAYVFSLMLSAAGLVAGFRYLRRYKPLPEKKKPDEMITIVFRDAGDVKEAEGE